MTKIKVAGQVEVFVKALAPVPRSALRQAMKALAQDKGDTKRLDGNLSGYHRLRVGGFRMIYTENFVQGERVVECLFCEARATVYELFLKLQMEAFQSGVKQRG